MFNSNFPQHRLTSFCTSSRFSVNRCYDNTNIIIIIISSSSSNDKHLAKSAHMNIWDTRITKLHSSKTMPNTYSSYTMSKNNTKKCQPDKLKFLQPNLTHLALQNGSWQPFRCLDCGRCISEKSEVSVTSATKLQWITCTDSEWRPVASIPPNLE